MADDNTPANVPAIPQDGQLSLPLEQASYNFPTDEGQGWAHDILGDVQQHVNAVNVADANTAAGHQFVSNVQGVKDNLVGMVHSDPTSVDLALGLAPKLIAPMLAATGLGDEHFDAVHSDLTGSIQTDIAHTAVSRLADFHADAAHALMDRLSDYIGGDENRATLGQYIDTLQAARNADNAVAGDQMADNQRRASSVSAYRYGGTLLDPRTEQVSFPPGYMANLVRNPDIEPGDKAPLFDAFSRLSQLGDVHASSPYAVANVVNSILDPSTQIGHGDIMSHVGDDLRYVDALMLHGLNLQRTPEGIGGLRDLQSALSSAKDNLAGSGDRAGDAAYSRFVNWLLPAYRRTGMSGLNPDSDNFLFKTTGLASFQPTHADAVAPISKRASLSDIFGGS